MFEHLFIAYKNHKNKQRYRHIKEILMYEKLLSVLTALTMLALIIFFVAQTVLSISLLLFSILLFICTFMYKIKKDPRTRKEVMESYRKINIEPVVDLLIEYNFYTKEKIDYLIAGCKEKLEKNTIQSVIKDFAGFISFLVIPMITFYFGRATEEWSVEEILTHATAIIATLLTLFITWIIIKGEVFNIGKTKHKSLLKELEYIRVIL